MPEASILDDLAGEGQPGRIEPPEQKKRFWDRGKEAPKKPRSASSAQRKSDADLRKSLQQFFREVAPGIAGFAGDDYDRDVIAANSDRLAEAYFELAKASPRFRQLLEGILTAGGPGAAAILATVAVVAPILHHHRVISLPPFIGVPLIGKPLEIHDEPTPGNDERDSTDRQPEPAAS